MGTSSGKQRYQLTLELNKLFKQAVEAHRAGRFDSAASVYQKVLAYNPEHPVALNLLGLATLQSGHGDEAIEILRKAVKFDSEYAEAYGNLGTACIRMNRPVEAIEVLQRLVALKPQAAEAHNQLGTAYLLQGLWEEAAGAFGKAILLRPEFSVAKANLARVRQEQMNYEQKMEHIQALRKSGELQQAAELCKQVLQGYPGAAKILLLLGMIYVQQNNLSAALKVFEQAVANKPDYIEAYNNLGALYQVLGNNTKAHQCFEKVLTIAPDHLEAQMNFAALLLNSGDVEGACARMNRVIAAEPGKIDSYIKFGEAVYKRGKLEAAYAIFRRIVELRPDMVEAHKNLGNILMDMGNSKAAIVAYDQAIIKNAEYAPAHWNRALAVLLQGRLEEGFMEYEWRLKVDQFKPWFAWCSHKPVWDGGSFSLKRLLVHDEQAMGDVLQFARYFPMVKSRGGIVTVSTKKPLLRLLAEASGVDEVIEHNPAQMNPDAYDVYVPLMSLPRIFGTTLKSIPAAPNYLQPPAECVAQWGERFSSGEFRVGLVWAGNRYGGEDFNRSASLQTFAVFAEIPGITFYSLQKGAESAQAKNPPPGMKLIDWTAEVKDFADTAGLIANLDAVVTVDTSVAHLAGAMGKPVLTLLPFLSEWRWQHEREDTPWYPSMRLFRQVKPNDWTYPVGRIKILLSEMVEKVR